MIIAAVRDDNRYETAIASKVDIIFDLAPDILKIAEKIEDAHQHKKKYYVHIDLAVGIGKDKSGIEFLKFLGVDGIVSTKASMIKLAKEAELKAIQRFFLIDSQSVNTAIDGIKNSKADMMEIMPGIAGRIIARIKKNVKIPIIAGGLVETQEDVEKALKSGAAAVSTGCPELWK